MKTKGNEKEMNLPHFYVSSARANIHTLTLVHIQSQRDRNVTKATKTTTEKKSEC